MLESPRVQDNLDKAKAARRTVIRYVQVVNDEELVGTLLEANEKVVEAIQMYDKVSQKKFVKGSRDIGRDTKCPDVQTCRTRFRLRARRVRQGQEIPRSFSISSCDQF